jgi:hypothetical protein
LRNLLDGIRPNQASIRLLHALWLLDGRCSLRTACFLLERCQLLLLRMRQ